MNTKLVSKTKISNEFSISHQFQPSRKPFRYSSMSRRDSLDAPKNRRGSNSWLEFEVSPDTRRSSFSICSRTKRTKKNFSEWDNAATDGSKSFIDIIFNSPDRSFTVQNHTGRNNMLQQKSPVLGDGLFIHLEWHKFRLDILLITNLSRLELRLLLKKSDLYILSNIEMLRSVGKQCYPGNFPGIDR